MTEAWKISAFKGWSGHDPNCEFTDKLHIRYACMIETVHGYEALSRITLDNAGINIAEFILFSVPFPIIIGQATL